MKKIEAEATASCERCIDDLDKLLVQVQIQIRRYVDDYDALFVKGVIEETIAELRRTVFALKGLRMREEKF